MSEGPSLSNRPDPTHDPPYRLDENPLPRWTDRPAAIPRGKLTVAMVGLGFWILVGRLLSSAAKDVWLPQAAWLDVLTATGIVALALVGILLALRPTIRLLPFIGVLLLSWIAVPVIAAAIASASDPV